MNQKVITKLKNWFDQFEGTITAFSGGIDSALVLLLSRKYLGKNNAIGVISKSESLKDKDYQLAVDFAQKTAADYAMEFQREDVLQLLEKEVYLR